MEISFSTNKKGKLKTTKQQQTVSRTDSEDEISQLCQTFEEIFVDSLKVAASAKVPEADLETNGREACYVPPRRIKRELEESVNKEIQRMKEMGVIELNFQDHGIMHQ